MWESRLNNYPQFTTSIDGQKVHFLHIESPEPGALPLILTHGWPGSIVEFLDIVEPLTNPRVHRGDPKEAFSLVIPSMPGYGFSGPTYEAGWNNLRIAKAWAIALVVATLGYYYRRRGPCGICGRGATGSAEELLARHRPHGDLLPATG